METASPPRLDLSPGGPERGQLTPMPFSGVERPHRASVPPIPLKREFPCLVGHREGTLSRAYAADQEAYHLSVASDQVNLIRIDLAQ